MTSAASVHDDGWVGTGEASRIAGVDAATVRRWANDGTVPVQVTPGGHRRYERRTLERIAGERARVAPASLGPVDDAARAVTTAYRRAYRPRAKGAGALAAIPATEHPSYREAGRGMVAALVRHLEARTERTREAELGDALRIARDLGARLAAGGTGLTGSVSLFVGARRPFLHEVGALARRRSLDPARTARLVDDASVALDRCLMALIGGHRGEG